MQSNQLKLAFTVAGTFVGAGFATGKELVLFFDNTPHSLLSLLICILITGAVSLLYFHEQKQTSNSFKVIKLLFLLFSGASYTVMLACGGETLWETTGISFPVGAFITWILTVGIVKFGVKNVYRFNLIATPVLLICMAGISLAGLLSPVGLFSPSRSQNINLLLYSGYNLLSVLPVLGALAGTVNQKGGYRGICLGFLLVLFAGLLLKGLLIRFGSLAQNSTIPVLTVVSHLQNHLSVLYGVMLYLSILTTAVNSLYALTKEKNTVPVSLFLLGCSFFGFSTLIESLYSFFGYLGIGVTVAIIFREFCQIKQKGCIKWQTKKM